MHIQHAVFAASLGLAFQVSAHAAPASYSCPQSIPQASIQLMAPDREWTPFVSSPLYLNSAAPIDGPPERLGMLRPRTSTKTRAGWKQTYALDGTYPEGKWLSCGYGALGEASLAKRLPDAIRECTVTTTQGKHAGENKVEVRCL